MNCSYGQLLLCVEQARSELTVGAAVSYSLAAHVTTAWHASGPNCDENVSPSWHAAQRWSSVVDPTRHMPSPEGHQRHAAHASLPADALKKPEAHFAHSRSLVAVGTTLCVLPAGHGPDTGKHAEPLSEGENETHSLHCAHVRSAVAEPAAASPCPAGQVDHTLHASLPAAALNFPAAHVAHVRSLYAVGALFVYSPAAQLPRVG